MRKDKRSGEERRKRKIDRTEEEKGRRDRRVGKMIEWKRKEESREGRKE